MGKIILRYAILLIAIGFLGFSIYFIFNVLKNKPPEQDIEQARKAIQVARSVFAPQLAKSEFKEAEAHYERAMNLWKSENQKPIYKRRYEVIELNSKEAQRFAKIAETKAITRSEELKKTLSRDLTLFEKRNAAANRLTRLLPLPKKIMDYSHKSEIQIIEAKKLLAQNKYVESAAKLESAEIKLKEVEAYTSKFLKDYFANYGKWQEWYKKTISVSRQEQTRVIIVDKIAHNCMIINNGTVESTYKCDFGKMWIGNKNARGDKATPEGMYHITDKKEGGRTKYYKALLINYPNQDDIARLKSSKKRSDMGGLIEIHGGGGTGADWTDGCVAISNEDMDKLFRKISKGTRVTIIGSLQPYEEVYSKIFNGGNDGNK